MSLPITLILFQKNILIQALQQFQGTYIIVSHNRHFISRVANKMWYIEDHEIKVYPGTYDEYSYWRSKKLGAITPKQPVPAVPKKRKKRKNTRRRMTPFLRILKRN